MPKKDNDNKHRGLLNTKMILNITVVIIIMVIVYYGVPYLYNLSSDMDEDYEPDREKSDTRGSWDIVGEVKTIRQRQKQNISKLSQTHFYGT